MILILYLYSRTCVYDNYEMPLTLSWHGNGNIDYEHIFLTMTSFIVIFEIMCPFYFCTDM